MKKQVFILGLVVILIFSIGLVSASDLNETQSISLNQNSSDSVGHDCEVLEHYNGGDILEDSFTGSELLKYPDDECILEEGDSDEGYVIYVGRNVTSDGGNGSFDNPFNNFELACDNVHGEDKVTLKIFNGTYAIGSVLKFNTSNLNVLGIGGDVIIKNKYNFTSQVTPTSQAFGSISTLVSYSMSNIIFDASEYTTIVDSARFAPFIGSAELGIYNNCSFYGFHSACLSENKYDSIFNNCYFQGFSSWLFFMYYNKGVSTTFNNCIFSISSLGNLAGMLYTNNNITFNDVWFGQNRLPNYIFPSSVVDAKTNRWVQNYKLAVTRYAILDIYEHFLGNNQYEIIGKMVWNDSSTDGIEKLNPMVVELSSDTGIIQSEVILKDGGFKVNYTSNLTIHHVFAKLDFAEFDLNFESKDIDAPHQSIYYGDDQNILVSLPQGAKGFINVTVNNKTYIYNVTEAMFNFTVPDILKEGVYDVKIEYIDKINHFYGNDSTQIRVSKISDYEMNLITYGDVKFGNPATVIIELPDDVDGLVNVGIANQNIVENASKTVIVNITGLNRGNNRVNVTYLGSDKYVPQSRQDTIYVDRGESDVVISNYEFVYGNPIIIDVQCINAIGFDAKLFDGSSEVTVEINGTDITVPSLDAGNYLLKVTTEVTDDYNPISKEFNIKILKAGSKTINPSMEYVYGELITVSLNSSSESIEISDEYNNSIKIDGNIVNTSMLGAGEYVFKIIRDIDKNHADIQIAPLTVLKALPSFEVIVNNVFVGQNVTVEVILPDDAKGNISINSSILDGTSITICNLSIGSYHVNVTYSGDENYQSTGKMVDFMVSQVPFELNYSNHSTIGEKADVSVMLSDNTEGNFTLFVNGNIYFNGTVNESFNLSVCDLAVGLNNLTAVYSSDLGNYSTAFSIDVGKANATLKISANEYITFILPGDATGNLTVFVNNRTYVKKLVNGMTTLSDLPAGTYDVVLDYSGDGKYNSFTENCTMAVKEAVKPVTPSGDSKKPANSNKVTKVASKIIAKNKKFKAKKKVKKYTITLKAGKKPIKKVQVTLKVKGKTYKAKTNAKGKVTFKIKNLKKKGKYKAVIKFKGNKNYKASTKKAKITVK